VPEPTPETAAHLDRLHCAITARDEARQHVFDVIREIIGRDGVKQADIVRVTGWTREYIRKIVKND
jgi:hypothetical protein